jgi:hypothetical protein
VPDVTRRVRPQVTLFIGNLTPEWSDAARLRRDMAAHGDVERAAVLRNADGASKARADAWPARRPAARLRSPARPCV